MKLKTLGLSGKQWIERLGKKGVYLSPYAKDLLNSKEFKTKKGQSYDIDIVSVKDLGFTNGATTEEIFNRAKEKGYDLCPPELGPILLETLKENTWTWIAMEPIFDRDGNPHVFSLDRDGAKLWLYAGIARPSDRWYADFRFVFSLRKTLGNSETKNSSTLDSLTLRTDAIEKDIRKIKRCFEQYLKNEE